MTAPTKDVADVTKDDATPAMQSNGVSPKPDAKDASNQDAILASWLKAQAHHFDREIASLASGVGTSVEALVSCIMAADEVKVRKTLGYRSLKMWIDEVIGDQLKAWSPEGRNALVRLLIAKGFTGTDAARLTGTSPATASRAKNEDSKGTPVQSTATDRLVKSLESLIAKVTDVDRFATKDLGRVSKELQRTVAVVNDELARRGTKGTHSGSEGTQGRTGSVTPKPAPPAK